MKKKNFIFVTVFIILNSSFLIHNCFSQWVQTSPSHIRTQNMESYYNKIYVCSLDSGLYYSTDNGSNWVKSSMINISTTRIHKFNNKLFLGTHQNGLYFSIDSGNSWSYNSFANLKIPSITSDSISLYAGCDDLINGGVYKSTNYGNNWSKVSGGTLTSLMFYSGKYLIAVFNNMPLYIYPFGIHYSTNYGITWIKSNSSTAYCFMRKDTLLYAGIGVGYYLDRGIRLSYDYGISYIWLSVLNNKSVNGLSYHNNYLFASTTDQGVYSSNNNFTTWIRVNEGLSDTITSCLLKHNGYLFVGTSSHGIWKREISQLVGINLLSEENPNSFILHQNYPNPFNSNTIIRFQIKDSRFVNLKVFDILGKEVATLVNEYLKPGTYETTFDASMLTGGIYFYRLQTENFSATKKLILLK